MAGHLPLRALALPSRYRLQAVYHLTVRPERCAIPGDSSILIVNLYSRSHFPT